MGRFTTFSYWTAEKALSDQGVMIGFIIFAMLSVSGLVLKLLLQYRVVSWYRPFFRRKSHFLLTVGIMGLVLVFFGWQRVPFFGIRLWYLLLGLGMIVWGIYLIRYFFKYFPADPVHITDMDTFEKYLPKTKGKR